MRWGVHGQRVAVSLKGGREGLGLGCSFGGSWWAARQTMTAGRRASDEDIFEAVIS